MLRNTPRFTTAAVVLACFQVFTAAWIFRKLPWPKPAWVNPVHRWSGRLAFACTLPVANVVAGTAVLSVGALIWVVRHRATVSQYKSRAGR